MPDTNRAWLWPICGLNQTLKYPPVVSVVGVGLAAIKCGHCKNLIETKDDSKSVLCNKCGYITCTGETCGYSWKPRKKEPKRCARCTAWLIPKPNEEDPDA